MSGTWTRGLAGGSCRRAVAILSGGFPDEGPGPGNHLVQHDAERVDVCRRRHRAALDLFGGHVRRGATDFVLRRHRPATAPCSHLGVPPRQTEIRDDDAQLPVRTGGLTSMTLWLLKSRCTTPAWCAAVKPAAI